jgi:hypothetical protein
MEYFKISALSVYGGVTLKTIRSAPLIITCHRAAASAGVIVPNNAVNQFVASRNSLKYTNFNIIKPAN